MSLTADLLDNIIDILVLDGGFDAASGIAYQGVSFDTKNRQQWLELLLFPNDNKDYFDFSVARGFCRVMVTGRNGTGVTQLLETAEYVGTLFPINGRIGKAYITKSAGIGSIIQSNDRITIPVTFHWKQIR